MQLFWESEDSESVLTVRYGVCNASDEETPQKTGLGVLVMVFLEGGVAIHNFVFYAMLLGQYSAKSPNQRLRSKH